MQTFKFKTSLKCNGCVNAIKPYMDAIKGIESWKVDLDSTDKIVEVVFTEVSDEKITDAVIKGIKQAGYSVEKI